MLESDSEVRDGGDDSAFLKGAAVALIAGVPVFSVAGAVAYNALDGSGGVREIRPDHVLGVALVLGYVALPQMLGSLFVGGALGWVVRALIRRGASAFSSRYFSAGLGVLLSVLATLPNRLGMKTDPHPSRGDYYVDTLHPAWIFCGAHAAGILCGLLIASWVRRGVREPPRDPSFSLRINLVASLCLLVSQVLYFPLWKLRPLYTESSI